jgi:1-deoxy-D-xylulose-5-phosphate reductoisomerase
MKAAAQRWCGETPDLGPVLERRVTVLGSTGSIGVSTLSVIAHAREVYGAAVLPVEALTANGNVDKLIEQAKAIRPRLAVINDESKYEALKAGLSGTGIETAAGRKAVIDAAGRPSDVVMVAIMGAAALEPALKAISRDVTVALANKECIVAAGPVFLKALSKSKAKVVPVDSEHNAVFQCLCAADPEEIEKVTLTASGGPFRTWTLDQMRAATPAQAVAHPNWSMGAKISVDSATMMNKGLELIEAHFLFAMPASKLTAVIHPQSIVHALVTYQDGTTLAHLSSPDMRTPIVHALAWPRRISSPSRKLDLAAAGTLTFEAPDFERFRPLKLALGCLDRGCMSPTILNAANEIAVDCFLHEKIGFLDIAAVVEATLDECPGAGIEPETVGEVLETDRRAREIARAVCGRKRG